MSRNYIFAPGEYYHIYARGFDKLPVFKGVRDYERLIESLYLFNSTHPQVVRDVHRRVYRGLTSATSAISASSFFSMREGNTLVDIGAYCLMPNHFHLLVREKDEKGKGVSKFMQKLMTSYTMYFNKKYERTGALFGSSFKAQHVTDDNHLRYLFAYIHLNPKKIINRKDLETYAFSSYQEYLGKGRPQKTILNKKAFPNYFEKGLRKEIEEWLKLAEV